MHLSTTFLALCVALPGLAAPVPVAESGVGYTLSIAGLRRHLDPVVELGRRAVALPLDTRERWQGGRRDAEPEAETLEARERWQGGRRDAEPEAANPIEARERWQGGRRDAEPEAVKSIEARERWQGGRRDAEPEAETLKARERWQGGRERWQGN